MRSRIWLWGTFASATIAYLLFIGPTEVLLPYVMPHRAARLGAGARDRARGRAGSGAVAAALLVGRPACRGGSSPSCT